MFSIPTLDWQFAVNLINIFLINLALSGDNAIVIGMAAASLPRERRKMAIIIGGGGAIVMRIILTGVATFLLQIPLLSAVGGAVLFWVAYKLLKLDVSGDETEHVRASSDFRQAIMLILAADFMMSLDNVIAVAGAAHGSFFLLIVGLLLSMPLILVSGGAISVLIDKFKWLVYVGAFAIAFTGARMIFEDKMIESQFPQPTFIVIGASILIGLLLPATVIWLNRRKAEAHESNLMEAETISE
jgi:YjbE family integral membrane protein